MTIGATEHLVGGTLAEAAGRGGRHSLTGEFQLHRAVASPHLALARDVMVWLPPGYATHPYHRYPVLYMHDGQNLFDRATSFAGREWMVDEALQAAVEAGAVEPPIVVGIYNTAARTAEYTHVPDPVHGGGGAVAYERFLIEELKPFVDQRYRTRAGPGQTGVAGSSLGGLFSLRLGLRHPDVFGRLGIVSPSVWWARSEILSWVTEAPHSSTRIWLDIGTAEGRDPAGAQQAVAETRALRDALVARGWHTAVDLAYLEDPGAGHDEAPGPAGLAVWCASCSRRRRRAEPRGPARDGAAGSPITCRAIRQQVQVA